MLSIIGIAAIAIAIYLLGRAHGKRSVRRAFEQALIEEFDELEEVSEFVDAQRMNALNQ